MSACSGSSSSGPEQGAGGRDSGAVDAPITCDAMPNMDCIDGCDGHLYGPSCVAGGWKCVGRTQYDCPDAADDAQCGPMPGPIDCADPCTGQFYSPSCTGGSWGCNRRVPDGGCVIEDAGDAAAQFPCGTAACVAGAQYCHQPTTPGNCPPPDSGICPPGCPGCSSVDPKCDTIPAECSNSVTCQCLLKAVCGSPGAGICQPTAGGLTLGCGGI
jgi:hypothetical protein